MTFSKGVAAGYEAWYDTLEGRRADASEKALLRRLLEGYPPVHSVLEVGAGTGHFTRWLSDQGLAALGLDLSAAMLEEAQALDGVLLVQGDALRLPFADGTFDLTALITTLEFLDRPREALAEALRVARCGAVLGVLNRWSVLGLQRRLAGLLRPTVYDAGRFYTVGELARLLRSVAGGRAQIVWETALLPRGWPWKRWAPPCGGFIGMALLVCGGTDSGQNAFPQRK